MEQGASPTILSHIPVKSAASGTALVCPKCRHTWRGDGGVNDEFWLLLIDERTTVLLCRQCGFGSKSLDAFGAAPASPFQVDPLFLAAGMTPTAPMQSVTYTPVEFAQPEEPTPEQCSAHALLRYDRQNARASYAIWYPQMGGYVAKAVVVIAVPEEKLSDDYAGQCFEAWVWHDGSFPFHDDGWDPDQPHPTPAHLHHCRPDQFVDFGEKVAQLGDELPGLPSDVIPK